MAIDSCLAIRKLDEYAHDVLLGFEVEVEGDCFEVGWISVDNSRRKQKNPALELTGDGEV